MTLNIRNFSKQADVEFAAYLTQKESWRSETKLEINSFYEYDPKGCFITEKDNHHVGICIATAYENNGFIGELIVQQAERTQGIGESLMMVGIQFLKNKVIHSIFLDGVLKAIPLYERLGFIPICRSLRLFGQIEARESKDVSLISKEDMEEIRLIDRSVFGDNRSYFLERRLQNYPDLCWKLKRNNQIQSYLFSRRGNGGWITVGPWVSLTSAKESMPLLSAFQSVIGNQPFSIGVLETNKQIVQTLVMRGMQPNPDPPVRMVLGYDSGLGQNQGNLAIGSPAKG